MDAGTSTGELAQQLFPGGKLIEFDAKDFDGMIERTEKLMDAGVTTIYEASFRGAGIFIMCDILHKGDTGWELYEVKGAARVKEYHRNDTAIQWYALDQLGIPLSRVAVVHIDNQYTRQGELELDKLFTIEEITKEVKERQPEIPKQLQRMAEVLEEEEPEIPIGAHCSSPYGCDFSSYCWKEVPKHSVFNLYNMRSEKKFALYHNGISALSELPDDYPLSSIQQLQKKQDQQSEPTIKVDIIRQFLNKIKGPVSYFDFETFQNAVPRFDSQRPYQQMPFQYSLHIQQGGELIHKEFLGDEQSDPRRALAEQMIRDIPNNGVIIAYNMGFERRVIRELAKEFADLAQQLEVIEERFIDLIDPFRDGGYYHSQMNGSFSIKAVLPALFPDDPDLSYKSLNIQNGGDASEIFANLYRYTDPKQIKAVRKDLLAYCRLDTLAMVKIVDRLKEVTE
jgi:hypothetical protein